LGFAVGSVANLSAGADVIGVVGPRDVVDVGALVVLDVCRAGEVDGLGDGS
jgi:hypothetical protein